MHEETHTTTKMMDEAQEMTEVKWPIIITGFFPNFLNALSLDNGLFVAATGEELHLCNSEGNIVCSHTTEGRTLSLCSVPGGKFVSGGRYDNLLFFQCEGEQMVQIGAFETHAEAATSLEVSALCLVQGQEKSVVVAGDSHGTLWAWDFASPSSPLQKISKAHNGHIYAAMAFPPGQPYFATGANDGKIKIWNSETLECTQTIKVAGEHTKSCIIGICPVQLPSTDFAFAITAYPSALIIVYEGNPNIGFKKTHQKTGSGMMFCVLEVAPGILLFPPEYHGLTLWNLATDSEKNITFDCGLIYALQKLPNGVFIGGVQNSGILKGSVKRLWKKFGRWFSVGRADRNSALTIFPTEVFFHFTGIVVQNFEFYI